MHEADIRVSQQTGFSVITFNDVAPPNRVFDALNASMVELCAKTQRYAVMDFLSVSYLFSRSIGILVKFYKEMTSFGKMIAIINASDAVKEIIEISKIDKIIPVFQTADDFLKWAEIGMKEDEPFNEAIIRIERKNGAAIVLVEGDPQSVSSVNFGKQLDRIIRDICEEKVVLNLSGMIALDSAGIAAILEAARGMEAQGRALALAHVNDVIKDLLELLYLDRVLLIADSVADALDLLDRKIKPGNESGKE
jgi:anti-anti-sigma factor